MRTHLLPLGAALVALFLVLAAPAVQAQGTTTAALSGTVVDADGLPLPGATVLAVHVPSGTEYRAAARGDGRYDLRGLRVGGPYTVTATFIGFQGQARTGLQLALSQTEQVDFTLADDAQQLGEVTVTAASNDAVIAAGRTGASTNITTEQIEDIPSISRSLADFARLSPLSGGQGSSSVAGRSFRANNVVVDGATLNDVFGLSGSGGVPGGQTGTQPISLDAVDEFNLDIAPYDVRYGNFTGAQINAVTKSGTNQFRGSLRFLTRSDAFVGDFRGTPLADFSEQLYIGTLGGPILRDKLFFFLSAEQFTNTFPNDVGLLGSNAATVFNGTAADLQSVIDAANAYGYDAGTFTPLSDDRLSTKLLGKIDWNINPTNRLSVRHNFVDADDDQGVSRSQGSFALSNRRYTFRNRTNSTTAQLNTTLGSRATNEARLVYTRIRDARAPETPFPQTQIILPSGNSVTLGIDRSSQANSLDQDLFELTDNLTLFRGAHTLTLGTTNQFFHIDNLFIQDFYGSYIFGDITDDIGGVSTSLTGTEAFAAGRPISYQFSFASQFQRDDQGRLLVDAQNRPLRTADIGVTPRAAFSAFQLGLYAQDEWTVTDRLRLTGGLRVDVPIFPDTPLDNPIVTGTTGVTPDGTTVDLGPAFSSTAFETFATGNGAAPGQFSYDDYSTLSTAQTPSSAPLISPRLGVNYRMDGLFGRSLQIRGGTGIFSGRSPFVFISNQYGNTGVDVARVQGGSSTASSSLGPIFSPSTNPADQPLPGSAPGLASNTTTAVNLVDPSFHFPQSWRTNIGFDQDLGNGFTATLEGIYSDAFNEARYLNLNYAQTGVSAYGRPLYSRGVNAAFTDAILLTNTDAGYEYSGYLQLQRRVRSGLGGSLSYTYSRAFNSQNATSDVANSNWVNNENVDINGVDLGTADFETRHRVLAYTTFRTEYAGRFSSELGLILDAQSGEPYSWVYNGDANGDAQSGTGGRFNDLVYVPAAETDVFLTSQNWPLLDAYLTGEDDLDNARGGFAERNSGRTPWNTRLDLNFTQGVNTVRGQRLEFEVTMQNVLNYLNDSWGRIHVTSFNQVQLLDFTGYVTQAQVGTLLAGRVVTSDDVGKPIVSFDTENAVDPDNRVTEVLTGTRSPLASVASRWQLRFGLRYQF